MSNASTTLLQSGSFAGVSDASLAERLEEFHPFTHTLMMANYVVVTAALGLTDRGKAVKAPQRCQRAWWHTQAPPKFLLLQAPSAVATVAQTVVWWRTTELKSCGTSRYKQTKSLWSTKWEN